MPEKSGIGAVANRLFRGTKGALTVAVLLGVLTLLLILPLVGAISKARADLKDVRQRLRGLVPLVHKVFLQMEDLRSMRLELVDMKRRYGGVDRIDRVLHLLTVAASEENVLIKDWTQKPKEQTGVFIKIPVRMKLLCRYTDLARYLNRITSSEYICVVTTLCLSENKEAYPKVSADMEVELVFVDPNAELGG